MHAVIFSISCFEWALSTKLHWDCATYYRLDWISSDYVGKCSENQSCKMSPENTQSCQIESFLGRFAQLMKDSVYKLA